MTKDKSNNKPSDSDLFLAAATGTRPLKNQNKVANLSGKKKIIPSHKQREENEQNTHNYQLSDYVKNSSPCTAEEVLSYHGNGIQQRFFRKLRNAQIPLQARLDLHGFTVDSAREILTAFIHESLELEYRCIIIVHGKGSRGGQPVLKPMLNHWLRQIPDILAFCSALPKDGGTGALYVLLKNTAKQSNDLQPTK